MKRPCYGTHDYALWCLAAIVDETVGREYVAQVLPASALSISRQGRKAWLHLARQSVAGLHGRAA